MRQYPLLGSYVKMTKANKYLIGSVKEMLHDNGNTFMIFVGPPQNTKRVETSLMESETMIKMLQEANVNQSTLVVHAPYLINLANTVNQEVWNFSVDFLLGEIKRCEAIGIKTIVLHPGAFTTGDLTSSLERLVDGLDRVTEYLCDVTIALETMSGKGTEVGSKIENLAKVLQGVKNPDRIGICLDTCHLNDAGYNLNDWDAFKNDFKQLIPLEKIKVIHLNDSKNPCGAKKDRHANIGHGTIGLELLRTIVWDEELKDVPKILETPYIDGKSPYADEIKLLLK